jgi:hypothetical protein
VLHLTECGAAAKRLHKNTSQPERKDLMPSRGSPIVKNPSKPNVEKADGTTDEAGTLKGADRNPVNRNAPERDANANAFIHVSGPIDE